MKKNVGLNADVVFKGIVFTIFVIIAAAIFISVVSCSKNNKSQNDIETDNSDITTDETQVYNMNITIDFSEQSEQKKISPYIYGINEYGNRGNYGSVTVNAVRQGGNRMTAYNWENNASNAGSDWKHNSDNHLSNSSRPADCATVLSSDGEKYGFPYKLTTLQMAGYVAADKKGAVKESEAAPSSRWNKVVFEKESAFDKTPDLTDGVVYMDEYVNYLVNTLGASSSQKGIQAYSLDNEPSLWNHTHSRIHPEKAGVKELSEKSIALATAVKKVDPNAEIFGPALYGYTAYDHLADDDKNGEWAKIKREGGYRWYIDYYLDSMKKAGDKNGKRLLDVLDVHYYSESARNGDEDRLQSVRTLYEKGFAEKSWIGQWCQQNIPILSTIQKSIDKYYPGTKLAISEYSFGGENVTGTIAQAEALGCYADMGVYFATLWGGNKFQFAGINLYTNYDGKKSHFGDTLIPSKTTDVSKSTCYASFDSSRGNESPLTVMLTNKSFTESETAEISILNGKQNYKTAKVYAVYGDSSEIRLLDTVKVAVNKIQVTLPPLCAAMIEVM